MIQALLLLLYNPADLAIVTFAIYEDSKRQVKLNVIINTSDWLIVKDETGSADAEKGKENNSEERDSNQKEIDSLL